MLNPTYEEMSSRSALRAMDKLEAFLLDPTEENRISVCFCMDNYVALKAVEEMINGE